MDLTYHVIYGFKSCVCGGGGVKGLYHVGRDIIFNEVGFVKLGCNIFNWYENPPFWKTPKRVFKFTTASAYWLNKFPLFCGAGVRYPVGLNPEVVYYNNGVSWNFTETL